MVDYVLFIGDAQEDPLKAKYANMRPSNDLMDELARIIVEAPDSINHTPYFALRHRPIAVSIETKTTSRTEEEARVQLGIWIASQLNRIWKLGCQTDDQPDAEFLDLLQKAVFPLVYVNSAQWTLMLARPIIECDGSGEKYFRTVIYKGIVIGDTSSIVGTYQLLSALKILREWAHQEYRNWWKDVIQMVHI